VGTCPESTSAWIFTPPNHQTPSIKPKATLPQINIISVIETCSKCGGGAKVIACIEDPAVIKNILDYLKNRAGPNEPSFLPETRAPPFGLPVGLFY
jgi:hypothetical protein